MRVQVPPPAPLFRPNPTQFFPVLNRKRDWLKSSPGRFRSPRRKREFFRRLASQRRFLAGYGKLISIQRGIVACHVGKP